jgi:hypothetical protein
MITITVTDSRGNMNPLLPEKNSVDFQVFRDCARRQVSILDGEKSHREPNSPLNEVVRLIRKGLASEALFLPGGWLLLTS